MWLPRPLERPGGNIAKYASNGHFPEEGLLHCGILEDALSPSIVATLAVQDKNI